MYRSLEAVLVVADIVTREPGRISVRFVAAGGVIVGIRMGRIAVVERFSVRPWV